MSLMPVGKTTQEALGSYWRSLKKERQGITLYTNKLQVKGFGWGWWLHACPNNITPYTVDQSAKWLEWIIRKEKKRKLEIPTKSTANIPQRKKTNQVGTLSNEVIALDNPCMVDICNFEKRANKMQQNWEVTGKSIIYSRMQPFDCPEIKSLMDTIFDYLYEFGKKGDPDYKVCWCHGEVIEVCENPKNLVTARVRWDPMTNSDRYMNYTESTVSLLSTFWKKYKQRAWRMDISIDIMTAYDSESDKEPEDKSESEPDSESEFEVDDKVSDCALD